MSLSTDILKHDVVIYKANVAHSPYWISKLMALVQVKCKLITRNKKVLLRLQLRTEWPLCSCKPYFRSLLIKGSVCDTVPCFQAEHTWSYPGSIFPFCPVFSRRQVPFDLQCNFRCIIKDHILCSGIQEQQERKARWQQPMSGCFYMRGYFFISRAV